MRNGHIGSNYTVLVAKIPQNQIRAQKSKEETLGFPNPVSELAYDVQIDFYDQVKLVNFYIFSPKIAKNAVFLKNHQSSFDHKNRSKRRMPILRPDLESLRSTLSKKNNFQVNISHFCAFLQLKLYSRMLMKSA